MRRNPVLAAAIVALGLLVFAFTVVVPRGREVGEVEAQVAAEDARVADLRTQLAVLEATPPTDVAAAVSAVREQVPSTAALPDLLRSLTGAAERAGVEFSGVTMTPGGPAPSASVSTIPLAITVNGGYFELARFLFELEHLDRLNRVSGISLSGAGEGGLSMSVTAEVYTTDTSFGPGADPAPGVEVGA